MMSSPDTDATRTSRPWRWRARRPRRPNARARSRRRWRRPDAALDAGREHLFELAQKVRAKPPLRSLVLCKMYMVSSASQSPVSTSMGRRRPCPWRRARGRRRSRCSWRCAAAPSGADGGDGAHTGSTVTRRSFTSTCCPAVPCTAVTMPTPLARKVCSIFIASSTTSPSPSATVSPAATSTVAMVPGSGARHSPAVPPRSSGSSSRGERSSIDPRAR